MKRMLKAIAVILQGGFETAFLLSVMLVCLRHAGKIRLWRFALWGSGLAAALSLYTVYGMKLSGPRKESLIGWTMALSFVLELLFLLWITRELLRRRRAESGDGKPSGQGRTAGAERVFLFAAAVLLVFLPLMNVAQFPDNIFIQTYSVVNTELILKFTGGLLGVALCGLFGLGLVKNSHRLAPAAVVTGAWFAFVALFGKQLITVVQILFARGVFPLTPLALKILIPLINHLDEYLFVLLGAAAVWLALIARSFLRRKEKLQPRWNPAVQRKFKAGLRREKRWMASVAALMLIISAVLGVQTALAGRTVELSPAQPVTPDHQHHVVIPAAEVNDRNLHRFGYTAKDGTVVRFIIIRKSETAYGIGFDACRICGSTGYYQKNGKVICRKCDVIMNIATIGFEGGCNPIPLPYRMEGGNIVIAAADLDQEIATFQQESVF